MSTGVIYQTRKKRRTRFNLPLHMIWAGRRDPLVGYMTSLAGMTSSLLGEETGSLEWYSIPRPSGSVMLRKRYKKKQNKRSVQITSREA